MYHNSGLAWAYGWCYLDEDDELSTYQKAILEITQR